MSGDEEEGRYCSSNFQSWYRKSRFSVSCKRKKEKRNQLVIPRCPSKEVERKGLTVKSANTSCSGSVSPFASLSD